MHCKPNLYHQVGVDLSPAEEARLRLDAVRAVLDHEPAERLARGIWLGSEGHGELDRLLDAAAMWLSVDRLEREACAARHPSRDERRPAA